LHWTGIVLTGLIIVLPQGILTFGSGFKTYYRQITDGDLLVLSTFFPKVPWRTDLAMARNPVIYGLANEIYVAESSDKGGTWSGVRDGLRKKRVIYVRKPEKPEDNANLLLIKMGAVPVDFNGVRISPAYTDSKVEMQPGIIEEPADSIDNKIRNLLAKKPLSVRQIMESIGTGRTPAKLTSYLKKADFIDVKKKVMPIFSA
jgi:predicted Rossmann fold nucleotide-binding protein DprA/Smf involved in DNA uptake